MGLDSLLASLIPVLSGSGPWGVAIGIGVMLLRDWLRKRNGGTPAPTPGPVPTPVDPAPAPSPLPFPLPSLPNRPILDALLKLLGSVLAPKAGDLDPQTFHEIVGKVIVPVGKVEKLKE